MGEMTARVYPTISSGILLGSITGIVKNHVLSRLPKGYVKSTYIRNSFFSVTERREDVDEAIMESQRPILSLNLSYSWNDPKASHGDAFRWGMSKIPVGTWQYHHIYKKVLMCEEDHVFITTSDERLRLTYELGMRFDSETQAYNLLGYMRSYVGVGRPYYIQNADLEVPVPPELLDALLSKRPFPVDTPDGLREFHAYVKRWSGNRLTFKKNLSTGNYHYFLRYTCNILCTIPDIPQIERNLENKSVTSADLRWTLEVEFPYFTNFIFEHEKLEGQPDAEWVDGLLPGSRGDSAIYNFTTKLPITRQLGNLTIARTVDFVTDVNVPLDRTEFKGALTGDLVYFVEGLKARFPGDHSAITGFIKVRLIRDDDAMVEGADYEISWEDYSLTILSPWANYVYRFAVYVDMVEYDRVITLRNSLARRNDGPDRQGEVTDDGNA